MSCPSNEIGQPWEGWPECSSASEGRSIPDRTILPESHLKIKTRFCGNGGACPLDRNERARLIWEAERYNRRTREKGRGGRLGLATLAIYRTLLFRFGADPQPSYEAIKTASGHCLKTIATAIQRLTAAGFLFYERRTIRTRLGARRITNRYWFPNRLPLIPREPLVQRFLPLEKLSEGLRRALDSLGKQVAYEKGGGT